MQARVAPGARPEVVIEIPENPDALRRADLDDLVRPAAVGFLRSYPSKAELLEQVSRIDRRQKTRPAWIPIVDRYGRPLRPPVTKSVKDEREPDQAVVVSALAELGDVTVVLPGAGEDLPRLDMETGGIGEWESVLHTVLGLAGPGAPEATIELDAGANMAPVPDEARWWPSELAEPTPAHEDPGVASELLATSATLGAIPIADSTLEAFKAVADSLVGAGDWRFSPRWLLESWEPGDNVATIASARAAIAGWAHKDRSGLIVYVYGGSVHEEEGQSGFPIPLHSYLLSVARAADASDTVWAVHRIVLSCPGEGWCHRGGCSDLGFPEADGLLRGIVAIGDAMSAVFSGDGTATSTYRALYGDVDQPGYAGSVLEQATAVLGRAGWSKLDQSTWEGGLEELLLRRAEQCLTVRYDPVTRQVQLSDGKPELESLLQLLGDEGILIEDGESEIVDADAAAAKNWDAALLAAADDLLRGRIEEGTAASVQATVLGLHPHADGTLRGPEAYTLADRQLDILLQTAGLIHRHDQPTSSR